MASAPNASQRALGVAARPAYHDAPDHDEEDDEMLVGTTWRARPLSSEQFERMMGVWGKLEADLEARDVTERLCWYITSDGSSGVTVVRVTDPDAATQFQLEVSLALSEFLELETRPVLDLETAMPAIVARLERTKS
jgi:hypothetical protein